jgi:hypothetical protein
MKEHLHIARRAQPEDDAELRQLMRETWQDGAVKLGMEKEPRFVHDDSDIVIVRHRSTGDVSGCGSRKDRLLWLHGREQQVAYLGDLRVHPSYRQLSGRVLQAGFQQLAQWQLEKPVTMTFTAIFSDNHQALSALTHERLGLPKYVEAGKLHTSAFLLPYRANIVEDTAPDLEAASAYLNAQKRDLSAVMTPSLLAEMADLCVLMHQGKVIGVAALADRSSHQQIRVHGYSRSLSLVSRLLQLIGYRGLPNAGEIFRTLFVAHLAARDTATAKLLLHRLRRKATQHGAHALLLIQHESAPMLSLQRSALAVRSSGRLYQVAWPGQTSLNALRYPQVEGYWL